MKNAEDIAVETNWWWENACGDMACDMVQVRCSDDRIQDKIMKAKRRGVEDIVGWLADELYMDEAYCFMIADHVLDKCSANGVKVADVCKCLVERGGAVGKYARGKLGL